MKVMKRGRNVGMPCLLSALVLAVALVSPASAALERVGPVNPANGGYPSWYQDGSGLALEFCNPLNQAELNDGWCLILPADVPSGTAPETFPTNYSGEHFYWNATAGARGAGAVLVLSLEAAFNTADPVAGEQVVFGRLRITIPSLPVSGNYKVYTPFGDFDFPGLVSGERLFFTSDIGIACGADFSCALNSNIGPFLLPSASPGGAELAAVPGPVTGKLYIADPARLGPVTGSMLPPFTSPVDGLQYDHNRFRIEINGALYLDEPNFTLAGRVMTGTIPGRVTINRASYARDATASKLDVFATAFPTVQGRLPGGSLLPATNPDLGFYDAPCATDPNTGAVNGPPTGTGLLYYQMLKGANNNWWGQNRPAAVPPQVCVQDLNARDATGNVIGAYFLGDVTDEVDIAVADWDPTANGGTLRVAAASSDLVDLPTLTVAGFGTIAPGTGELLVSDLAGPPAKVSVTSTRGGVAALDVRTGVGIPVSTTTPVANADSASTLENSAVSDFNVLANDTLNGGAIPAGASVTVSAPPRLGTAKLNGINDQTITYTPNLNVNGTDIVGYKVTVTDAQGVPHVSNEGYLTIVITPINDIPVANDDAGSTLNNIPLTINVLANDTDLDGPLDLAHAVIASVPGPGATLTCNGLEIPTAGTVCTGGLVTFTPTAGGTYAFTYFAQDKAGALSAAPATATVTVIASQQVAVTAVQFKGGGTQEWRVDGTATPISGLTTTITVDLYDSTLATKKGTVGTATADALGVWRIRLKGTGFATAVNGDRVVATSSVPPNPSSASFPVAIR